MGRFAELWYTTGSNAGRLPEDSAMAKYLWATTRTELPTTRISDALREVSLRFGAINDAAASAAMSFEDARDALMAVASAYGDEVLSEPDHCAFCSEDGERRRHLLDTQFLSSVPIWTRVCEEHREQPLCPKTPTGVHDIVITADSEEFELRYTVVVDPDHLADVGYCSACHLPLALREGEWLHWTAQERGRLLAPSTKGTRGRSEGGR